MARSKTYELSFQVGATLAGSFSKVFKGAESALQQVNGQLGALGKQQAANARLLELRESLETSSLKLRAAKQHFEQLRQEMSAAGAPTKQMQQAMDRAAQAVQKAQIQVDKERGALHALNAQMGTAGTSTKQLTEHQKRLAEQAEKSAKAQQKLQQVIAAQDANKAKRADLRGQLFDGVALAASMGAPLKAASDFETAMLGVAKQVEGARDESGNLTEVYHNMGTAIKQMAREIPMAHSELADMVTAGARMGVATKELEQFTRTSAMMAEAFELPAGELADNMGKIAGLYKIPIPAIGELADTINWLDDNAISKGGDIIDYLTRVGGIAGAVKVSGKEMAALGSTLLTLGERTETAGTATNAMFQKLAAADKGTKKFHAAMREIGLSTKEVQKGMQKDAMGTMLKVLDNIGKLDADKRLGVMVELVGLEHSDTMAKLATNTGELRKQLEMANSEAAQGSMAKEFAARLDTTGAQAEIAKNKLHELGINLGSVLLPTVNKVLGVFGTVSSTLADLAQKFPLVTQVVGLAAAGLISAKIAAIGLGYGFTFLKGAVLSVQAGIAAARAGWLLYTGALVASNTTSKAAIVVSKALAAGQWLVNASLTASRWLAVTAQMAIWRTASLAAAAGAKVLAAGQWLVNAAMSANPIGLVIVGIGALIAAGVALYKNWDTVSAFFAGAWDKMKAAGMAVVDWIKGLSFYDSGMALLRTLGDGIMAAVSYPVDAIKGALAKVREYLPFSDAKVGPLSELTLSGQKIMTTLGDGMGQANIADVTAPLGGIAAAANAGVGGGQAAAPARGGDTYNITIQVPAGSDPVAARAAGTAAAESFEQKMREFSARRERLSYAPA